MHTAILLYMYVVIMISVPLKVKPHLHKPKKINYLMKDSEKVNDNKDCLLFLLQNILFSYIIFSVLLHFFSFLRSHF